MKKIKPEKLKKGSTIAIISPSWGGPSLFPGIYEKAISNLKEIFQLNIIEYPTARMDDRKLYENPRLRANDINDAFKDKSVDGIFASIGGSDSIRILPYLDIPSILENPKIIMGFSDSVTFLTYLNTKGLVTFHGPSMMAGWAQIHNFDYLQKYYSEILMENRESRDILPFPTWSNGYPSWADNSTIGEVNELQPNTHGFLWLQGKRTVRGEIWGGCMEVIDWLKGTQYWPEPGFWNNRILMLETSEEKPTPEEVGFSLRNLGIQGVFEELSGIMIGRPKDYNEEEKQKLYDTVLRIVAEEFGNREIPIIANMDFGHTDPNMIIPMGIRTEIVPVEQTIKFVEKIFED